MGKSWQLGLVSLCMVILGVLGIWVSLPYSRSFSPVRPLCEQLLTIGLFGFLIVMGLWSAHLRAKKWNEGEPFMPGFLLAYRDAWKRITGQKWLLMMIGFIAVVNALGMIVEHALSRYYLADEAARLFDGGLSRFRYGPDLAEYLPRAIVGTLGYLFPDVGLGQSGATAGFLALSVLFLLPWVNRQLISLQGHSSSESAIKFFRKLIWPVGIISLPAAVGGFYFLWYQYASLAAQIARSSGESGITRLVLLSTAPTLSTWIIRSLVVIPMLVGGISGSLQRVVSGGQVNARSFLEDSVRFFKPIAGIFLMLGIIPLVADTPLLIAWAATKNMVSPWYQEYRTWFSLVWRLVMVMIMFAPYVISANAASTWRGLRGSIDVWMNCGYNLLSFTALGIAGLTAVLMIERLAGFVPPLSPYVIIPGLVVTVLDVAISIMMAVAVWELYQQIRSVSAEDEVL